MDELDPFPDPLETIDGIAASIARAGPHTPAFVALELPEEWTMPAGEASWALQGLPPVPDELPRRALRQDGSRSSAAELMQ